MPIPPKGMNSKSQDNEYEQKRRKDNEPDGPASAAVKYLKMGFMPTDERLKAEETYERDQKRKKEQQND